MRMFMIEITTLVQVEVADGALGEEFMEQYRAAIAPLYSAGEHAERIAELVATGALIDGTGDDFVEGYGVLKDAGITPTILDTMATTISEEELP